MVIISGDIFDSKVPTVESLQLFNDVLYELVMELKVKVLAVRGNHDCPARIGFGSHLMKPVGFYVAGNLEDSFDPVILEDEHGLINAYLIPYACLDKIQRLLGTKKIHTYGEAYAMMIRKIRDIMTPGIRSILVTHALVSPGGIEYATQTDGFQPLADQPWKETVPLEYFAGFHYTALGHLHEPMCQDNNRASYPGAPLKYTFKTYDPPLGFNLVDMDSEGRVDLLRWPVTPVKDLQVVEGKLEEILKHKVSENYVEVRLLEDIYLPQAVKQIEEIYPNVLLIRHAYHHLPHLQYAMQEPKKRLSLGECDDGVISAGLCQGHSKRLKRRVGKLVDDIAQRNKAILFEG